VIAAESLREAGVFVNGGAVDTEVVRSALDRFPLVMDLVNLLSWPTHACVWLGPTRPGLICFMLRPGMACHPGADVPFWSQVTTWLVDLVVSWADQVSNDSGGSCCAGQHTQSVWLECRNAVVCFCSPFVLNCACPDLVRKLA